MDERRRFQIALGGIGSSLLIAALVVTSAPPLTYPAVPPPPPPYSLQVQSAVVPPEGAGHVPAETRTTAIRRTPRPALENRAVPRVVSVLDIRPAPIVIPDDRPLPSRATTLVFVSAPATRSAVLPHVPGEATDEPEDGGRSPVTGAFVTAGKEVGRGVRTAGRAIRALF